MRGEVRLRDTGRADAPALAQLYAAAFPAEPLWPLVDALLHGDVPTLSLAACDGKGLIGHALFTPCGIEGGADSLGLLGPLAVAPARQRQGIGSALVHAGLGRLAERGVARVCVLGDPANYGRLGFTPEARIVPPYALPPAWADAWQSQAVSPGARHPRGRLDVPPPWRREALWLP